MDFANSAEGRAIFDSYIVNDDVNQAYEELYELLKDDIAATLESQQQKVASS